MSAAPSAVFMPLIAAALWIGLGALASSAAGRDDDTSPVPRLMWPVLGFAATVVLANSLSRLGIVLPWGGIIIGALAVAGLVLQRRALLPRPSDVGFAALAAGPVVLAFLSVSWTAGPTHAGFLADSTTGVHMLGADFLLHEGGGFDQLKRTSSDDAMIYRYFVEGVYPSGAHALLGLMGAFVGSSLLWIDTPLMGLCLGVAALTTMSALRSLDVPRALAATGGLLASCGALAVAFAFQGSIKEIVALPLLAGMTALALADPAQRTIRSTAVQAALLTAALYAAIGLSAAGWVVPFVGFLVLRTWLSGRQTDRGLKPAALTVVGVGALTAVLSLPLLPGLADQIRNTQSLSQTNAGLASDPGNLMGPINKWQAFGTWISKDHRAAPFEFDLLWTYGVIGISILLALVGGLALLREKRWWPGVWLAGLIALWYVLTARGTMWIDSKLVLLNGVTVTILMVAGITWLARRREGSRLDPLLAALLVVPLLGGVIASGNELWRGTTTAPTDRYRELETIDAKFKGQGPILNTEFDEYAMYTLRDAHVTAPGLVEAAPLSRTTTDGAFVPYGRSVSANQLPLADTKQFPLLLTLRSPLRTSPGSDWSLVFEGKYFEVWRRDPARTDAILRREVIKATKKPAVGICKAVTDAAAYAKANDGKLVVYRRAEPVVGIQTKAEWMTPNWAKTFGAWGSVSSDGRLVLPIPAASRSTEQDLWISGSVGRPLVVKTTTGQTLGTFERLASGDGTVIGPVRIPAGTSKVLVQSTQRELRAGDTAPSVLRTFYLASPQAPTVEAVDPADAERELCDAPVDWIDVVPAASADATAAAANAKP